MIRYILSILGFVIGQILPYLYLHFEAIKTLCIIFFISLCCTIGIFITIRRISFKYSSELYYYLASFLTTHTVEIFLQLLILTFTKITASYLGLIWGYAWFFGFTRIFTIPIIYFISYKILKPL